jgi:branched-chain amino acid transport system ATP-binding protein
MRVVFNLADRVTVLAAGRVLAEGTPAHIAADEAVQTAYLGRPA